MPERGTDENVNVIRGSYESGIPVEKGACMKRQRGVLVLAVAACVVTAGSAYAASCQTSSGSCQGHSGQVAADTQGVAPSPLEPVSRSACETCPTAKDCDEVQRPRRGRADRGNGRGYGRGNGQGAAVAPRQGRGRAANRADARPARRAANRAVADDCPASSCSCDYHRDQRGNGNARGNGKGRRGLAARSPKSDDSSCRTTCGCGNHQQADCGCGNHNQGGRCSSPGHVGRGCAVHHRSVGRRGSVGNTCGVRQGRGFRNGCDVRQSRGCACKCSCDGSCDCSSACRHDVRYGRGCVAHAGRRAHGRAMGCAASCAPRGNRCGVAANRCGHGARQCGVNQCVASGRGANRCGQAGWGRGAGRGAGRGTGQVGRGYGRGFGCGHGCR